ncbi:MAG: hypothetical protein SQA66_14975 [Candidatus Fervidibacter sacchari]
MGQGTRDRNRTGTGRGTGNIEVPAEPIERKQGTWDKGHGTGEKIWACPRRQLNDCRPRGDA